MSPLLRIPLWLSGFFLGFCAIIVWLEDRNEKGIVIVLMTWAVFWGCLCERFL